MQNDIESLMQKVSCASDTEEKIQIAIFLLKHSLEMEAKFQRAFKVTVATVIITEGEWEYFVVQYAANRNKTNVASI